MSVISVMYEVYKKLLALNATIDKQYRYSLSEPCIQNCTETLKQLILAKHAPKTVKSTFLVTAGASGELTAMQLRAILELKLANETNILKIQAKLSEGRRQIGGWRKSLAA